MAITFEKTPLEWNNAGAEPSTDLKTNGFVAGYKPAADTFNYQINNSSACLTELQTKLSGVDDDVTTLEGTVSELDQNAIRGVRGKGTLITPMSDKTVNITAASVGAAASSHNHSADNITSGTLPIARGGTGGATASAARANLDVLHATQLYSNNSATTGTITLSDTVTNYSFLEIYFRNKGVYSIRIVPKKDVSVLSSAIIGGGNSAADATLSFYAAIVNISGTTITFSPYHSGFMKGSEQNTYYNTSTPGIMRIVGYKY